jgi:predicted nucleic acid-binding protein
LQLVIADTSPINYLLLIGHIEILPSLFEKVIMPSAVRDELTNAPALVRRWIADPPSWVAVRRSTGHRFDDASFEQHLDAGEEDAIALAVELHADLLLMDDREGVIAARRKGLTVTGTLGVLGLAGQRGLLSLAEAFHALKGTNFHYRQDIMDKLLIEMSGVG